MKTVVLMLGAGLCMAAASARADEKPRLTGPVVRVERRAGRPQVVVDGEVTPARMFWGRSNCRRIPLATDWRRHEMRLTPHTAVKSGVFRFVTEENRDGRWEVRGLCVRPPEGAARHLEARPQDGKHPVLQTDPLALEAEKTYRVSFEIRGSGLDWFQVNLHQQEPGAYRYHAVSVPWDDAELTTLCADARQARAAGCRFISYFAPLCWFPEGEENWAPFDAQARQILSLVPDALLIPRVSVNAPVWWCRKNPDHTMFLENGPAGDWASVSSRLYRKEAGDYLRKVVRHFMETFPDNFAGIHFSGQNTAEWFYWNSQSRLHGYDVQTRNAFRAYLAERGDPDAATAEVPTPAARHAGETSAERFFDPVQDRRILAFARFQQEEMVDLVGELARICREATDGKKLVLSFYGYSWEHAGNGIGPANTGHYGLMRLLKRWGSFIDVLSGPQAYSGRDEIGGVSSVMSPAETIVRHGILWVNEDDLRTHAVSEREVQMRFSLTPDVRGDRRVMTRTVGMEVARGLGGWWMDLFGSGWYSDPTTWAIAADLHRFEREMLERPLRPIDIAAVCDEESVIRLRLTKGLNVPVYDCLRRSRDQFPKSGYSVGQYLLEDILDNPPDVKAEIHFGTWRPRDMERLRTYVKARSDVTRVWCWAPPDGVTGFDLQPVTVTNVAVRATERGQRFGLPSAWSVASPTPIAPLFRAADAAAQEVLATWPDGSPAVAVRRNADGRGHSIFCGIPEIPVGLVACAGRIARAHAFLPREMVGRAVVWPGNGFVTVQAIEDAAFTVETEFAGEVVDVVSGASCGLGPSVRLRMKAGDIVILKGAAR